MRLREILFLIICIVSVSLNGVDSVKFLQTSKHQRIRKNSSEVADFYCNAASPINKCQFRIWNSDANSDLPLVENLTQEWRNISSYVSVKDFNTDLAQGRCGLTLKGLPSYYRWLVGCRVLTDREGWMYHYTTLYVTSNVPDPASDLSFDDVEDVFATPGSDVNVTCSTSLDTGCDFYSYSATKWTQTKQFCRITLRVTDFSMIWCRDDKNSIYTYIGKTVVAANPPNSPPELKLSRDTLEAGDLLEATCSVSASRPRAAMAWYLGDQLLTGDHVLEATCSVSASRPRAAMAWYLGDQLMAGDHVLEVAVDAWRWKWTAEARTQTLRRRVTAEDHNKTLSCVASHLGLKQSMKTSATLSVRGESGSQSEKDKSATCNDYILIVVLLAGSNVVLLLIVASVVFATIHKTGGCCHRSDSEIINAFAMDVARQDSNEADDNVYDDVAPAGGR